MRRWNVRLGDKTTAGGVVLEGEPSATCEGEQLSYSGARIRCPACNSTGQGLAIPPYHFMTFNGNQALMDGDLCICKCNPPPKLIASQTSMGMAFESTSEQWTQDGFGRLNLGEPTLADAPYDEMFVLKDETNEPVAGQRYRIKDEDGHVYEGVTNSRGETQRIVTPTSQNLTLELL